MVQASERRALGRWGGESVLGERTLRLEGQVVVVLVERTVCSEAKGGATQASSGQRRLECEHCVGAVVGGSRAERSRDREADDAVIPWGLWEVKAVLASPLLHERPSE